MFTSRGPNSGVDDIKVAGFAETTPSDANVAVYDRDAAGNVRDAHASLSGNQNIQYNEIANLGGTALDPPEIRVLAQCTVVYGPPCVVVTEPKPENLGGYIGFAVQGVRGVDDALGHWTTPDARSGAVGDPASQLPYMYERNNSFAYSDPSGYCTDERAWTSCALDDQWSDGPSIYISHKGKGKPKPPKPPSGWPPDLGDLVRRLILHPPEKPPPPGRMPTGRDNHPLEVHHRNQDPKKPTVMTRTDHRLGPNYKINHQNTGQQKSRVTPQQRAEDRRTFMDYVHKWIDQHFPPVDPEG